MSTAARKHILDRVRAANGGASSAKAAAGQWLSLPRNYRRSASLSRNEILSLFEDRLRDYDAHVVLTPQAGVPECIAARLHVRNLRSLLIPPGMRSALPQQGFTFVTDTGAETLTVRDMDQYEGVITESTLAIAETGTIVLQNVSGEGRRALTLVPDYHLCIVQLSSIVETVPEAISRLQSTAHLPTTFISGPSATADIEMTRIKGVHGPRILDVIIVSDQ
jgi:L-lactate dehydrogenase complex protein LldG